MDPGRDSMGEAGSDPRPRRQHRVVAFLAAALVAPVGVGVGLTLWPAAEPVQRVVAAEPYRFAERPVGSKDAARARGVARSSPTSGGSSLRGLTLITSESPPQLNLYLPPGSLLGRGRIRVVVTPEVGGQLAQGVRPAGNVYRVQIIGSRGKVHLGPPAELALLAIRAVDRSRGHELWFRPADSSRWRPITSRQVRDGIYVVKFLGAGEYAVGAEVDRGGDGVGMAVALVAGSGLGCLALLLVRRSMSRRNRSSDPIAH